MFRNVDVDRFFAGVIGVMAVFGLIQANSQQLPVSSELSSLVTLVVGYFIGTAATRAQNGKVKP